MERNETWNKAKALLELIGLSAIPPKLAEDMTNKFRSQLGEGVKDEELPEPLRKAISLVQERLSANTTALFERFVDIYADTFTSDEISALTDYYKGPVAQLLNQKNEGVQSRVVEASNTWSAEEFTKMSGELATILNAPHPEAPAPQP